MTALPFRLVPFETATPPSAAPGVSGTLALDRNGLHVVFELHDPHATVKFSRPGSTRSRRDELWRTTCFELFLKPEHSDLYWEINLAPHGDWNAYRLSGYRKDLHPEAEVADIPIKAEHSGAALASLRATVPLPAALTAGAFQIGVSCVIEGQDGAIRYFALRHAGAKPDFHDPRSFTLRLDPTSN